MIILLWVDGIYFKAPPFESIVGGKVDKLNCAPTGRICNIKACLFNITKNLFFQVILFLKSYKEASLHCR